MSCVPVRVSALDGRARAVKAARGLTMHATSCWTTTRTCRTLRSSTPAQTGVRGARSPPLRPVWSVTFAGSRTLRMLSEYEMSQKLAVLLRHARRAVASAICAFPIAQVLNRCCSARDLSLNPLHGFAVSQMSPVLREIGTETEIKRKFRGVTLGLKYRKIMGLPVILTVDKKDEGRAQVQDGCSMTMA
jgi:hypothetical protein